VIVTPPGISLAARVPDWGARWVVSVRAVVGVPLATDEAERMTRRVEVDAKAPVLRRLVFMHGCTGSEHGGLRAVDVSDGDVEVELLWVGAIGPSRGDVVVDALKGERGATVGPLGADSAAGRDRRSSRVRATRLETPISLHAAGSATYDRW
jgi:hypothetical protein